MQNSFAIFSQCIRNATDSNLQEVAQYSSQIENVQLFCFDNEKIKQEWKKLLFWFLKYEQRTMDDYGS